MEKAVYAMKKQLRLVGLMMGALCGVWPVCAGAADAKGVDESKERAVAGSEADRLIQLLDEYAAVMEKYAHVLKKIREGDFSYSEEWTKLAEQLNEWSAKWGTEYLHLYMGLSEADMERVSKQYEALQKRLEQIMGA
jgi:leucyl aminopeptidase (aminopeptidase T)